jgi:UDP-glucose-4-epimerase GalE
MSILITGSAGYIGSHLCLKLENLGIDYLGIDNLVRGHRIINESRFFECDICDDNRVAQILKFKKIDTVIHLAAFAYVQESISNPFAYYENNVEKTIKFIRTCVSQGIRKLIFSSSCAIYGNPDNLPIVEDQIPAPISPYGHTKLIVENFLRQVSATNRLNSCSLRYFNAAGASLCGKLKEEHNPETHFIPLAVDAAICGEPLTIFGDNLNTRDGSAERDFTHVDDLASAHIAAIDFLKNNTGSHQFNIGSGIGVTLKQVVEEIKEQGLDLSVRYDAPRLGDPNRLYADPSLALKTLKWRPKNSDLKTIIETTIRSRINNNV